MEEISDQKVRILAELARKFHKRKPRDNPFNPLQTNPYVFFVGLTDLGFSSAQVRVSRGAINEDTLVNPRIKDELVFAELRVGTRAGMGVGYYSDYLPIQNGLASLEQIVRNACNEAYPVALESYYDFLKEGALSTPCYMPNLVPIGKEVYLENERKHRIPTRLLKRIAIECSKLLQKVSVEDSVTIFVYDEVRRYANSDGSMVRDTFFGYNVILEAVAYDAQGRRIPYVQNLQFSEYQALDTSKILNLAQRMAENIAERYDCPVLEENIYPCLFSPEAMAIQLHEAFAHLLSSEEILYEGSTTWGWENFGRKVANRNMDVFIDPWMDGRWGSQFYDAEGILARKRVLIKDGVVQGYIADRNGAYHLSRLVGENIMPGDSRFMISSPEDVFVPEPRISNLDVVYKGSGRPKTKSQMWLCFMDHLKKQRTEGIYFPDKAGGESDTTNGLISCTYDFPYIVRRDGTLTPTKFLSTESDAQTFLRNIKLMGEPRVYTPHFCGDDVYQPMVRAGLRCGSGIVRNIHVVPERKVGRRQKMY